MGLRRIAETRRNQLSDVIVMVSIDVLLAEKARLNCNKSKRYSIKHPEKIREYNMQYKKAHREEHNRTSFFGRSVVRVEANGG